jgi:hypothetical protein
VLSGERQHFIPDVKASPALPDTDTDQSQSRQDRVADEVDFALSKAVFRVWS